MSYTTVDRVRTTTPNGMSIRKGDPAGTHAAGPDGAGCLMGCGLIRHLRGLCHTHYEEVRQRVIMGHTTWSEIEAAGQALPDRSLKHQQRQQVLKNRHAALQAAKSGLCLCGCSRPIWVRGLAKECYKQACQDIYDDKISWASLIDQGKALGGRCEHGDAGGKDFKGDRVEAFQAPRVIAHAERIANGRRLFEKGELPAGSAKWQSAKPSPALIVEPPPEPVAEPELKAPAPETVPEPPPPLETAMPEMNRLEKSQHVRAVIERLGADATCDQVNAELAKEGLQVSDSNFHKWRIHYFGKKGRGAKPGDSPQRRARAAKPSGNGVHHPVSLSTAPGSPVLPMVDGKIGFAVNVQVNAGDLAGWSPDRIKAFFEGAAQVLAAQRGHP